MKVSRLKRPKILPLLAAGICALSMAACSTTQTAQMSNGAPISYKDGSFNNSGLQQTALVMPNMPQAAQALPQAKPQYAIPSPYTGQAQRDDFDQSSIDRNLYDHQKVGNTYTVLGQTYTPSHRPDYDVVGDASWYGDKFHGKPTATGETYNKHDITAAHKTLPLNSYAYVTNMQTGKSIMVRLNDRGPFIDDRIIDLSEAAARELGTLNQGIGQVRVRYAGPADRPAPSQMFANQQHAAPAPQEYQPLREQTAPDAQVQAPQNYAPVAPEPQYAPTPQPAAPQPIAPQNGAGAGDAPVTLTIKGPIHMAKATTTQADHWHNAFRTEVKN
ncbi:MAG: septal ring lytic transglycosylase RlpA family protein [Maricaulaceae bacterium]